MTLYRAELREAAATALMNAKTIAGVNVFTARSLPIKSDALPAIYLQVAQDRAESQGRGPPAFTRNATLAIRALVSGGTPENAELTCDIIAEQIEQTLMCDYTFQSMIQQVSDMTSEIKVTSETDKHIGEVRMLLGLEYYENFMPGGQPLTAVNATIAAEGNAAFAEVSVPLSSEE